MLQKLEKITEKARKAGKVTLNATNSTVVDMRLFNALPGGIS